MCKDIVYRFEYYSGIKNGGKGDAVGREDCKRDARGVSSAGACERSEYYCAVP